MSDGKEVEEKKLDFVAKETLGYKFMSNKGDSIADIRIMREEDDENKKRRLYSYIYAHCTVTELIDKFKQIRDDKVQPDYVREHVFDNGKD